MILSLGGCGAGDVAKTVGGFTGPSIQQTRAQNELNDFNHALSDGDYNRACSHLTQDGFTQLVRLPIPLQKCPEALAAALKGQDLSGSDLTVTDAHATSGEGIQVKADSGERFTLDSQYRIAHYFPAH